MIYNPYDWYWLADDGRLYASARQIIVDAGDASYVAWSEFNAVTQWPRDLAGHQTDAALQEVLTPYRIFVNLTYYTANARFEKQGSGIVINGLPFATDAFTLGSLNSAYIYTQAKTANTFSWKLPDGSFITLNKTDIAALLDKANSFVQACYTCEDTTLDGIEGGTIIAPSQIDAAFAAINNSFTGLAADTEVRHRRSS